VQKAVTAMKALGMVVACVGVVVLGSGCMSAAQTTRSLAAGDLRCPVGQVQVVEVATSTFRARGCGREAFYLDSNGPVAEASSSTGTHAHWRFASTDGHR
jgi:hypothetical protein